MRKRYLKEIAFNTSNFYEGEDKMFLRETSCLEHSIEQAISKKLECDVEKLVFNTRSENYDGPALNKVMWDSMNNILVIEEPIDLKKYNAMSEANERLAYACDYLRASLRSVPKEHAIDVEAIEIAINQFEDNGYSFDQDVGRKVNSPSKSVQAQLNIRFDTNRIAIVAKLSEKKGDDVREVVLGEYDVNHSILEQPGKLSFLDENTLEYRPKAFFDPLTTAIS